MQFPSITGSNLLRQTVHLPEDFSGEINLVFVPFYQVHQFDVNTWIPFARRMEQEYEGSAYYELPTIQRMNRLRQMFINEGMRAGIPDPKTRLRTVTLYLDKGAFRRALEIDSEAEIHVFLVDRQGSMYAEETGPFTPEKGARLRQVLDRLAGAGEEAPASAPDIVQIGG
jgi:hypothetical protein